jgi:hypothetical protein
MEKRSFDLACFAFACAGAEFLIYGLTVFFRQAFQEIFLPKIIYLRRSRLARRHFGINAQVLESRDSNFGRKSASSEESSLCSAKA